VWELDEWRQAIFKRTHAIPIKHVEPLNKIVCFDSSCYVFINNIPQVRDNYPDNSVLAKHSVTLGKKHTPVFLGEVFQSVGAVYDIDA